MAVESLNALIFGADEDRLSLGPHTVDLSKITTLDGNLPAGMLECGWISEDGVAMAPSDSVQKKKGHQGAAIVKTFMESSETTLKVTLLESKLDILKWSLSATAEKIGDRGSEIAKITVPSARKIQHLCGVLDLYDTGGTGSQWRIIFPKLQLGARGEIKFQNKEIVGHEYELEVIGNFTILSNTPALIPA